MSGDLRVSVENEIPGMSGGHMGQLRPGTLRVSVGAGCLLGTSQEIPGISGGHMGQLRPWTLGCLLGTSQETPGMSGGHMGQLRPGTLRMSAEGTPGNSWDVW